MSRITFENYGKAARHNHDLTLVAGRYKLQKQAERRIVPDVAGKLLLAPEDRLLEIGCGPGGLLIPLSFLVAEATGIDHPDICARLEHRFNDSRIKTIGINFLDYEGPEGGFDKILIYGVMNSLTDRDEALLFIDKAVKLLAPGGRLLIGDIANIDCKKRFLSSKAGQEFQKAWEAGMAEAAKDSDDAEAYEAQPDHQVFQADDAFIASVLSRFRSAGMQTYLLPQPVDLPFGMTREDILIVSPR